jgi:hypothetical protein
MRLSIKCYPRPQNAAKDGPGQANEARVTKVRPRGRNDVRLGRQFQIKRCCHGTLGDASDELAALSRQGYPT